VVRFEHVSKVFPDGTKAVDDINLEVERGEFVCLIGPSGCGKTTTLKMVNRLYEPTSGTITINGRNIMDINPVELRRSIGYVIQQIGLFPHMTIAQNVELVPRLLGWDAERRCRRVDELLPLVGLSPARYRDRYPRELSGGQQQRVGVIRALAAEPDLILMDEPFGALDPITRETLQDEVKRLQKQLRKTVIFVTHDMDEAIKLADRIVVMKDGRIHQVGTPEEILRHPKDEFVAQFIGRDRLVSRPDLLTVAEVMIRHVVTTRPETGLVEAINLMKRKRVDSLVVTDEENRLLGIATARAFEAARHSSARTVADVMQDAPATIRPDESVQVALEQILRDKLDYLPVVDEDGFLQGLITRTSLVDVLSRAFWQGASA